MSEAEAPFRPREKLIEKQKYFQNIHKHTYLKGPYDQITSLAIPLALAATSLYMIENLNSKSYINTIKMQVFENLRCIQHAPSVQMHEVPPDFYIPEFDEDEQNPDERMDCTLQFHN